MFPLRGRLVLAAVVAAALASALAACDAGAGAQTSRPYQPTDGVSTVLQDIAIRDAFVLGAAPNQNLPAGGSAGMFLGLVNNGAPDRLLQVAAPGTASSVQLPQGAVPLPMHQPVLLTGPVPRVVLQKLTRPLGAGQNIPMVLYFQNAGTITLNVPVVARSAYYTTFSPPASPAPAQPHTLRPAPGANRTARGTPGTARSPGAAPTATASPTP